MTVKILQIEKYKELLEACRLKYPNCFAEKAKPLKTGILDVIEIEGLSKTQIRAFLQMYTSTKEYVEAHIPLAIRIDLDGNPAGIVTEEECESKKSTKVVSVIQRIFERGKNPPKKKFKKPQQKNPDQDPKEDTKLDIKKPIGAKTLSIGWNKKEEKH